MRNLWETLRSLDIFGAPVGLTYKGADTFKTMIGGCFSLTTIIVIFVSATVLLVDHFQNEDDDQIISSIFKPYNTEVRDGDDSYFTLSTQDQVVAGNLIYGVE